MPDKITPELQQIFEDLLSSALEEALPIITDHVTSSISGGTAGEEDSSDNPLEARLKVLETQLHEEKELRKAQELALEDKRFESSLNDLLDAHGAQHKGTAKELLINRLRKEAYEKDGQWIMKSGHSLEDTVGSFMKSDEGLLFTPPTHRDGAGSKQPSRQKSSTEMSVADALFNAF